MARTANRDPLDKFRWSIEIDGFTRMGFTSVETPSVEITTKMYKEGGNHLFPRQIIDSVSYPPIALTRGVTTDLDFDRWARQFIELVGGNKKNPELVDEIFEYRRNVKISHLDRVGRPIKTYTLFNAIPIEYKPASEFSADGDDSLSMEKLVLAYESFQVDSALEKGQGTLSVDNMIKKLNPF